MTDKNTWKRAEALVRDNKETSYHYSKIRTNVLIYILTRHIRCGNFASMFIWIAVIVSFLYVTSSSGRCWLVDEKPSCPEGSTTRNLLRTTQHFLISLEMVAWDRTNEQPVSDSFIISFKMLLNLWYHCFWVILMFWVIAFVERTMVSTPKKKHQNKNLLSKLMNIWMISSSVKILMRT